MNIVKARQITGFEKCDFDAYSDCCDCGEVQHRYNAENYLRTSYEYDEGVYMCNRCVIALAKVQKEGREYVLFT